MSESGRSETRCKRRTRIQQWAQNSGILPQQQQPQLQSVGDVYQNAPVTLQPTAVVPQPTASAAQSADSMAPTINPATGAADYSAQWAAYYRSIGLVDQAAMVENQMRRSQAAAAAVVDPTGGQPQYYSTHPQ
ncbi:unnamed protein product [Caenorhabditis sp. 36 PRJEB53466]|nr:unnamed protein product [Caenorhabditis sp. 36 PRJEB53466]